MSSPTSAANHLHDLSNAFYGFCNEYNDVQDLIANPPVSGARGQLEEYHETPGYLSLLVTQRKWLRGRAMVLINCIVVSTVGRPLPPELLLIIENFLKSQGEEKHCLNRVW